MAVGAQAPSTSALTTSPYPYSSRAPSRRMPTYPSYVAPVPISEIGRTRTTGPGGQWSETTQHGTPAERQSDLAAQQAQYAQEAFQRQSAAQQAAAAAQARYGQEDLMARARLNQDAQAQQFQQMQGLFTQSDSGGTAPTISRTGGSIGATEQAARAAAFARAKEQTGRIGRSSLTGLREALASRNMLGGGAEAVGTGQIVGGAEGALNEFTREQMINDFAAAQQAAGQEYSGAITQRGQDLSAQQAQRNALYGLMRNSGRLY